VAVGAVGQDLGQAPVQHQHLAEGADHDVARLEVAVHHPAAVREGDRIADLEEGLHQLVAQPAHRRAAGRLALVMLDQVGEVGALDALHGVEHRAVGQHLEVVHRHDAGMFQLGGDLRLVHEAADRLLLAATAVAQGLERDAAAAVVVQHLEHHPLRAAADGARHLVAGGGAGERGGPPGGQALGQAALVLERLEVLQARGPAHAAAGGVDGGRTLAGRRGAGRDGGGLVAVEFAGVTGHRGTASRLSALSGSSGTCASRPPDTHTAPVGVASCSGTRRR
jgi:hypothetical protein